MVLEISQETFDNAVKENVEFLGLTQEEAVDEAVKQFEAQGVDLSKIVKESMTSEEFSEINSVIKKLDQLQKSKAGPDAINATLEVLKTECEKGLQHKVAAGKADAYYVLLNTFETCKEKTVKINTLKALISLMTKQPDLLDDRGINLIINTLKNSNNTPDLLALMMKWTKECCVMHEMNRQKIYDAHMVDIIKEYLKEQTPIELIREILAVSRSLVLDDDVRVEFGKAHEHARVIASETLCSIMNLLSKFKAEEQLNLDIILTLTALMVRTEFCKKVQDAGGIELIKSVMEHFADSGKLVRQCFMLLKALAGNDECKAHIIQKGFVTIIKDTITINMESVPTVTAGLSAVAALTLRSPQNSNAFFASGIPDVIIAVMKRHPDQKPVQKTASWAIRNMVSRNKNQAAKYLELGAEDVLRQNLKNFKDIEYDTKAALRDLGCKVELKEAWTGKGGALTTGGTRR